MVATISLFLFLLPFSLIFIQLVYFVAHKLNMMIYKSIFRGVFDCDPALEAQIFESIRSDPLLLISIIFQQYKSLAADRFDGGNAVVVHIEHRFY